MAFVPTKQEYSPPLLRPASSERRTAAPSTPSSSSSKPGAGSPTLTTQGKNAGLPFFGFGKRRYQSGRGANTSQAGPSSSSSSSEAEAPGLRGRSPRRTKKHFCGHNSGNIA